MTGWFGELKHQAYSLLSLFILAQFESWSIAYSDSVNLEEYCSSKDAIHMLVGLEGQTENIVFLQNIGVLDPNVGPLSIFHNSNDEEVNHVLLHCPFAWKI